MNLTSRKKVLSIAVAIATAIVGFFVFVAHSEPFKHATQWATRSPEVHQALGNVIDVSALPRSFSFRYNDTRGFAHYNFTVTGTRGEAKMYVRLQKDHGNWRVVEATMNGSALSKLE